MFLDDFIDKLIGLPTAIMDKLKPADDLSARVDRYADLEGLSTKQLNVGLWYRQKTKLFFYVTVWFLVITASVLWSYSLYYLGDYFFVGLKQDRQSLNSLTESVNIAHHDFDVNLSLGQAQALPLADNRYDLIGSVNNKNIQARASFAYYFLIDGKPFGRGSAFILPQQERLVLSANVKIETAPANVTLVLENFNWQRVNYHEIPDWKDFQETHINFAVRDKVFVGAGDSGLSENLSINQVSFSLVNQTPFNYLQAPFFVLLYNKGQIVSINRYVVLNFEPKKQEAVTLTITGKLPPVDNIEVVPDIDIMDKGNFGPIE